MSTWKVMGGVNSSPDYVKTVGIGEYPSGRITSTVHQGGIVSIYCTPAISTLFLGGWFADVVGRINGVFVGATLALVGGALQAASQSSDFILVARVLTGLGTGALVGIVPVYVAEVSKADHRGKFLGYVFIANYLGISVAYWLDFGLQFIDNGLSPLRWRFLLGFQCVPAIVLLIGIKLLPDSPRYLVSAGRHSEALEVLQHIRGESAEAVNTEMVEMVESSKGATRTSPASVLTVLLGRSTNELHRHLGRRAWLCIWLQIMASWSGITAVTTYSPILLAQAGYSATTQAGLAGGINTIGIAGTVISANLVDPFGRRKSFMVGSLSLAIINAVTGGLFQASIANPSKATSIAPAAVFMLFLFNLAYASTWGTLAFLIPTEIFPSEMRAQGNAFGITGWAIGVGMTVLINPLLFSTLQNKSYFLFAALNFAWIPIIYFFYPETSGRSLESITHLFDRGFFNNEMEAAFADAMDYSPRDPSEKDSKGGKGTMRHLE
ncbi:hypothetical protein RQP46_006636 [Phenoliferia psychrophenolica]